MRMFVYVLQLCFPGLPDMPLDMSVTEIADISDPGDFKDEMKAVGATEHLQQASEWNIETLLHKSKAISGPKSETKKEASVTTTSRQYRATMPDESSGGGERSENGEQCKICGRRAGQEQKCRDECGIICRYLESQLSVWVTKQQEKGASVRLSAMASEAKRLARTMDIDEFVCPSAWLSELRSRCCDDRTMSSTHKDRSNTEKSCTTKVSSSRNQWNSGSCSVPASRQSVRDKKNGLDAREDTRKRKRLDKSAEMDKMLLEWILQQEAKGEIAKMSDMLPEARRIARKLNIEEFTGSATWLREFRARSLKNYEAQPLLKKRKAVVECAWRSGFQTAEIIGDPSRSQLSNGDSVEKNVDAASHGTEGLCECPFTFISKVISLPLQK